MTTEFKKTYSLAEIAGYLKRPTTTVSTWRSQFKEYLPTVGEGRGRRYTEEAIELFTLIAKMKDAGEPHDRIKSVLQQTATEVIVYEEQENPSLMQELMNGYSNILEVVKEQKDIIEAQQKAMQEMQEKLDSMGNRIEAGEERADNRDKALMEAMRDLQESKSKKGWFDKFLGR